ncbi:hypothetical protein BH10BAC1_BH10BAC1_02690 [soil metagenome]
MTTVEIPLSKKLLVWLLTISIIFVFVGLWFIIKPPHISNPFFGNTTKLLIVGTLSVLFFGYVGFSMFKKLFDKVPGLLISKEGILNNSSGFSKQFIPWADILSFNIASVQRQTFVNILVRNPEDYINREKNFIKRKLMKINFEQFDSVISISHNGLNCSWNELNEILVQKFEEYKTENTQLNLGIKS